MEPDPIRLYQQMLRSRLFEQGVQTLWQQGLISGEMHLSMGEEAIAAGVVCQLEDGDAMALDYRATAPLLMHGCDPVSLLREFLGRKDGLCGGQGGHMHLFSQEHLAASSGIVGASGPAGVGFALAAQYLRPGKVALSFFGDGALNQGMLMESMNLAAVWKLPLLFVCKDNHWAISTHSSDVTAGTSVERARSFGMPTESVDGLEVRDVWRAAHAAIDRARRGEGPAFIHASCVHLAGHLLGDQLLRTAREPLREIGPTAELLVRSITSRVGAPHRERVRNLGTLMRRVRKIPQEALEKANDPLHRARRALGMQPDELNSMEARVHDEIKGVFVKALAGPSGEE
jgi:pyruvate dehydrogenase E1 component alpha subunit